MTRRNLIICDRCGTEIVTADIKKPWHSGLVELFPEGPPTAASFEFDLCPKCMGALKAWLAAGKTAA